MFLLNSLGLGFTQILSDLGTRLAVASADTDKGENKDDQPLWWNFERKQVQFSKGKEEVVEDQSVTKSF